MTLEGREPKEVLGKYLGYKAGKERTALGNTILRLVEAGEISLENDRIRLLKFTEVQPHKYISSRGADRTARSGNVDPEKWHVGSTQGRKPTKSLGPETEKKREEREDLKRVEASRRYYHSLLSQIEAATSFDDLKLVADATAKWDQIYEEDEWNATEVLKEAYGRKVDELNTEAEEAEDETSAIAEGPF